MSFIQKCILTFNVSSSGAAAAQYSSVYNGFINTINAQVTKAVSTKSTINITGETTSRSIIKIYHPSTLGGWFYPMAKKYNSSGASSGLGANFALANERVRVLVACSSGTKSRVVTVGMWIS